MPLSYPWSDTADFCEVLVLVLALTSASLCSSYFFCIACLIVFLVLRTIFLRKEAVALPISLTSISDPPIYDSSLVSLDLITFFVVKVLVGILNFPNLSVLGLSITFGLNFFGVLFPVDASGVVGYLSLSESSGFNFKSRSTPELAESESDLSYTGNND